LGRTGAEAGRADLLSAISPKTTDAMQPLNMMNKKIPPSLWIVLILEYLFIFIFLLNYDLAWMNPEKFGTHQWILSNGPQWKAEDWGKFLNIDVIEYNPDRLSRPLSNFIEVINAKWRAWCWHFMLPHPALSLLWPFLLILLPYLLYLTFLNMGSYPCLAFTGICVYLATLGFLGPLVMLFHPAKGLVNLFTVSAMFLFSIPYRKLPSIPNSPQWALGAAFISLYLGFISDETGLYAYVIALVLFYRLWIQLWRNKHYLSLTGLLSLPLIYLVTIKYILPWIHWLVRHKSVHLNNYESYPSIKNLFLPDWTNFWQNMRFLLNDHPHWWFDYNKLLIHPVLGGIQIIYLLFYMLIIGAGGMTLFKNHARKLDKNFAQLSALGILLLIGYCFFHTFQLSKNAKIWGIWWYGSLFSLIYVFTLVFFLQFVFSHHQRLSKLAVLLTMVFVINGLAFTTYRIAIFKKQNLNRNEFKFQDIFREKMDVYQYFNFENTLARSNCKRMYTYLYWQKWRSKQSQIDPARVESCKNLLNGDIYFPIETLYLPIELNKPFK
jgi:hypothetical protein